jgi:hypothetical protein
MKRTLKKTLIVVGACLMATVSPAQVVDGNEDKNIDWQEKQSEIVTLDDIIRDEQSVTQRKLTLEHYQNVWGGRTYLNLSHVNDKLKPDETIPTGLGTNVGDFKSDWGAALTIGRNFRLHKRAIANVAQFNLDFTFFDLNVNHFKAENGGKDVYDSRKKTTDNNYYTPWNLEKFEGSFGMNIGPSLTIAPFTYTNSAALHFIKFNIYWHMGYHISGVLMNNNHADEADMNKAGNADYVKLDQETMDKKGLIDWGLGVTRHFGFNVSWKFIGLGYETRTTSLKYTSMDDDRFGDGKYKFKTSQNRLYLQFRF